jgi:hypothetical protein
MKLFKQRSLAERKHKNRRKKFDYKPLDCLQMTTTKRRVYSKFIW